MGEQPEPNAAEVAINVAVQGPVLVKYPTPEEIETEPSDNDLAEVVITVRAKGSVAVSFNVGTPEQIADSTRVGHIHHDEGTMD